MEYEIFFYVHIQVDEVIHCR